MTELSPVMPLFNKLMHNHKQVYDVLSFFLEKYFFTLKKIAFFMKNMEQKITFFGYNLLEIRLTKNVFPLTSNSNSKARSTLGVQSPA